jgi:hypothetical protein
MFILQTLNPLRLALPLLPQFQVLIRRVEVEERDTLLTDLEAKLSEVSAQAEYQIHLKEQHYQV